MSPSATRTSLASRSLRSAASGLPTDVSTQAITSAWVAAEPAESVALDDLAPSSLVLAESGLVPRGEGADHHQGVTGASRDRLAEAEQAALGRLGEPAERERPDARGADEVRRSLRRLAEAPRGEAMAQSAESPRMRARHAPAQELEVLQRDRGFGDADIVAIASSMSTARSASVTAASISASVGER